MFRTSLTRAVRPAVLGRASGIAAQVQRRQAHAISNPTLANIEKRWEGMPPQEQAELWMALRDRMKANWAELTLQEKKAGMLSWDKFFSRHPIANNSHKLEIVSGVGWELEE